MGAQVTIFMRCSKFIPICVALVLPLLWAEAAIGAGNDTDEALVRDIEDHLIAPCCWTQPISEHESAVSEQMREEVRTMVAAGMDREAILDHFVLLHGERVLATPRPEGFNRLVYILPWAALVFGAAVLFILLRKLRTPLPDSLAEPAMDSRYSSLIAKELKDLEEQ